MSQSRGLAFAGKSGKTRKFYEVCGSIAFVSSGSKAIPIYPQRWIKVWQCEHSLYSQFENRRWCDNRIFVSLWPSSVRRIRSLLLDPRERCESPVRRTLLPDSSVCWIFYHQSQVRGKGVRNTKMASESARSCQGVHWENRCLDSPSISGFFRMCKGALKDQPR